MSKYLHFKFPEKTLADHDGGDENDFSPYQADLRDAIELELRGGNRIRRDCTQDNADLLFRGQLKKHWPFA